MAQSKARKRRQRPYRFDRTRWVEQLDKIIDSASFQYWFRSDVEILLTCGKVNQYGVRCGRTLAVGQFDDDTGVVWGGHSYTGTPGRQIFERTPNHRRPRAPGAPYRPRPWSRCDVSHQDPPQCCDIPHEPQRTWHCHPTKCGARYPVKIIKELRAAVKLFGTGPLGPVELLQLSESEQEIAAAEAEWRLSRPRTRKLVLGGGDLG